MKIYAYDVNRWERLLNTKIIGELKARTDKKAADKKCSEH